MNALIAMFGLVAALAAAQEAGPAPKADGDAADAYADEGYTLVWSDEFDEGDAPSTKDWEYELGFVRNREAQIYRKENVSIKDGLLVIEARQENMPNPRFQAGARKWQQSRRGAKYTSGSIKTIGKHEWKYGRFEMRGKIDTRAGMWPAFWTLGRARGWPGCGEIDVMEYYRGMLLANACWAKAGRGGEPGQSWDAVRLPLELLDDPGWAAQFHVWRMDWDEDAIVISVDGRVLNTVALSATANPDGSNPFREPHYILLNLAIGGTNGGDPTGTEFPGRFEVDYVRVYQKRE